ncbi:MAG: hypothetical protein ACRDZ3_04455 [Acidimicrobiia bacterium]
MSIPTDQDTRRPEPAVEPRRPVLVVGTDDWAAEQAVVFLEEAGHETLTCHPLGEPAFPCNALVEGRTCPLDVGFDVVVTVRARPLESPSPGELGAVCGLHAGASLVVAGMTRRNPFGRWASVVVDGGDVVGSVEQALEDRDDAPQLGSV